MRCHSRFVSYRCMLLTRARVTEPQRVVSCWAFVLEESRSDPTYRVPIRNLWAGNLMSRGDREDRG